MARLDLEDHFLASEKNVPPAGILPAAAEEEQDFEDAMIQPELRNQFGHLPLP